uniref:Putative secreted protein n=1 Tax=Anopheles darlingi TaxID=43151 RepID=A0A2M4D6P4_ANODA
MSSWLVVNMVRFYHLSAMFKNTVASVAMNFIDGFHKQHAIKSNRRTLFGVTCFRQDAYSTIRSTQMLSWNNVAI